MFLTLFHQRWPYLRFLLFAGLLLFASSCSTRRAIPEGEADSQAVAALVAPSMHARRGKVIFLDAGHGGKDSGAQSPVMAGINEKDLALSTTLMVQQYLQKLGYKTALSRRDDRFLELQERVALAHQQHASLFVSIHYNAATNHDAHGVEVFFFEPEKPDLRTYQSRDLAESVLARVVRYTRARNRGVKHGNFAVIRETKIPSILVEGGFVTNEDEMNKLRDPRYQAHVAKGIAVGLDEYVQKI